MYWAGFLDLARVLVATPAWLPAPRSSSLPESMSSPAARTGGRRAADRSGERFGFNCMINNYRIAAPRCKMAAIKKVAHRPLTALQRASPLLKVDAKRAGRHNAYRPANTATPNGEVRRSDRDTKAQAAYKNNTTTRRTRLESGAIASLVSLTVAS